MLYACSSCGQWNNGDDNYCKHCGKAIKATIEHSHALVSQPAEQPSLPDGQPISKRSVSIWLGLGIFLWPYIFAWFTLRKGHSPLSRKLSLGWLGWWCALVLFAGIVSGVTSDKKAKASEQWMVEQEALFCQILERTKQQYKEARSLSNSIAKEKATAAAVQARKDALGELSESFVGWVAQVKNVSASSGTLSLNVNVPCDKVKVELKHTRPANSEDEAIFASLEKGGWVLVSGSFYPGTKERDHFRELSIFESGSMDEPEFQVAFFKVKPVKNKTERHTPEEEAQLRAALASFHDELLKDISGAAKTQK